MENNKAFLYVSAVAETNSFSEAANKLGLAQSALSRYILKLEKSLNVELFDRTTLPVVLTEAGRVFVEAGRQVLDINRQLEKRLEDIRTHKNMILRIGTGPSRAPALMPLILSNFAEIYPNIRVMTTECRTAELVDKLTNGKLDLIITFYDQTTASFAMEELFEEKVELAVPDVFQDKIINSIEDGAINIRKLKVPFISLHEGQQLRNALELLTGGDIQPQYTSEYQESAMSLVSRGFGVALTPSYWKLIDTHSKISYYPLILPDNLALDEKARLITLINRRVGLFYRKNQFLSEAENAYIQAAKKACKSLK